MNEVIKMHFMQHSACTIKTDFIKYRKILYKIGVLRVSVVLIIATLELEFGDEYCR